MRPGIRRNFLQKSNTQAAKFLILGDKAELEREYDWLEYCKPLIDPELVVLPKPHGPLITHGKLIILVMGFIGGIEVEDKLKNGQTLSDVDAGRIVDAYLALRHVVKPKGDELCPTRSFQPRLASDQIGGGDSLCCNADVRSERLG